MTRLEHAAASPRRARWLAPVLAAAAAGAVAVGVTAVSTSGNGNRAAILPATQVSTPAPTPTSSDTTPAPRPAAHSSARPAATATPPAQMAPPLLRNGQQADRSQIPWSQVGPGWHLISSTATPKAATAPLYLVNPIGGRYLISQVAVGSVRAWSPDGRRALLIQGAGEESTFTELELATGRVLRTFNLTVNAHFVSYSRPKGQAILVSAPFGKKNASGDTEFALQRFGTDGRHQLTYPNELPGLGKLSDNSALYSPDGTELLIGARNGVALLGNDGHLIRTLPAPAKHSGCMPIKWWNAATVLMSCQNDALRSQLNGSPSALLLQPVAGGSPTKLAGGSADAPFGFWNAWKYSGGLLLREGSGCGPGELTSCVTG